MANCHVSCLFYIFIIYKIIYFTTPNFTMDFTYHLLTACVWGLKVSKRAHIDFKSAHLFYGQGCWKIIVPTNIPKPSKFGSGEWEECFFDRANNFFQFSVAPRKNESVTYYSNKKHYKHVHEKLWDKSLKI